MKESVLNILQTSSYAPALQQVLMQCLGISPDVLRKEATGIVSATDAAKLTVLRHLFDGMVISTPITTLDQTKALVHIRNQRLGRMLEQELKQQIIAVRQVYENEKADENTRLLLMTYKRVHYLLYRESIDALTTGDTQ